ncbi:hypothetical protein Ahy_B10g105832 [Arachis hypogaea]|uniref:MADS-box domain-containing protein n=1 Tax=Arachis hypogaea TaxID=3818 RepID=A0A444X9A9_ARAHY|nr:hypothetical protein Ahy_B10g105832 [Arachis hypogaea]
MMDNNCRPNLFSVLRKRRVSFAELARQYEMAANNNDDDIPKMKRRMKLQLIDDMNSRKATFRKRRAGLLKKLEQLAILYDIQACIAIFSPGDKNPTVWPSVEEAKEIVEKFEEIPEPERPVTDFSDDELDRFLICVDDKLKAVRNSITISTRHSEASTSLQPPPAAPLAVQPLIISGEVDNNDDFFGGLFFEDESSGSVLFPVGDKNVLVVPPAEANEELFAFGDFADSVDFGDLDNFSYLTVGTDDDDDDDFLIDELLLPNQGNAAGNTSNDNHKGVW